MSRRGAVEHHVTPPDTRYGSRTVQQFINKVMLSGKKSLAERIVYKSFERIENQTHKSALETFEAALRNATPVLEVKPRRVGGATYQVPVEIRSERKQALAFRWLIASARKRPGHSLEERLAAELLDAAHGQGATIKRKEDMHRMAESNRAFSHFRI
ncbi:MAG: 30S ribosomal protein S7 [Chloroflexi bacterium]|nr:30S ribosomal protein S7 [Chloroflexota bacterium]MCL5946700.1 30S ribosomal protein S7 [Chloroflexota bacterium]